MRSARGGPGDGYVDRHRLPSRPIHSLVSALRELWANSFKGTATFTAPNQDLLKVKLKGSAADPACLATKICDVGFTGIIDGGTGRFQNAVGTLTGTGTVNLINFTVTARLHGSINKNPEPF